MFYIIANVNNILFSPKLTTKNWYRRRRRKKKAQCFHSGVLNTTFDTTPGMGAHWVQLHPEILRKTNFVPTDI